MTTGIAATCSTTAIATEEAESGMMGEMMAAGDSNVNSQLSNLYLVHDIQVEASSSFFYLVSAVAIF